MFIEEDPEFVSSHRASIQADRYKPLQLSEYIYFGSQEGIRRHPDLIRRIGIDVFVGVDMTEQQAALLYNDPCITALYPSSHAADILMLNFEPQAGLYQIENKEEEQTSKEAREELDRLTGIYHQNNTQLLQTIYQNTSIVVQSSSKRFPDIFSPFQPISNSFKAQDLKKFQIFNQLLDIIRLARPESRIYIFSASRIKETMVSLLISHMLRCNPNVKITDALQFVKNLAVELQPNETPLSDEKVIWNGYLLQYYEMSKRETVPWYQTGFSLYGGNNVSHTTGTSTTSTTATSFPSSINYNCGVDDYNSFERSFNTNTVDNNNNNNNCTVKGNFSIEGTGTTNSVLGFCKSAGDMRMKRPMRRGCCSREYEFSSCCSCGLMGSDQMMELARCKRARSD